MQRPIGRVKPYLLALSPLVVLIIGLGTGLLLSLTPPIPVYPHATILIGTERNAEAYDSAGHVIGHFTYWPLHTHDSPMDVMAYYDRLLPAFGWTVRLRDCTPTPASDSRIFTRPLRWWFGEEWLEISGFPMIEKVGFSLPLSHIEPIRIDMSAYQRSIEDQIIDGRLCRV